MNFVKIKDVYLRTAAIYAYCQMTYDLADADYLALSPAEQAEADRLRHSISVFLALGTKTHRETFAFNDANEVLLALATLDQYLPNFFRAGDWAVCTEKAVAAAASLRDGEAVGLAFMFPYDVVHLDEEDTAKCAELLARLDRAMAKSA